MVADVKEFCKTCDKCQRANRYIYVLMLFYAYVHVRRKFEKTSAELHPSPVRKGWSIWPTMHIDQC